MNKSIVGQRGQAPIIIAIVAAALLISAVIWATNYSSNREMSGPYSRVIPTSAGDLTVRYENGAATISGTLARGTPCINWHIEMKTEGGNPSDRVTFDVISESTAAVCIQVEGEPQTVSASAAAGVTTTYTVRLNGTTVFDGRLKSGAVYERGYLSGSVNIGPLCPVEQNPPDSRCKQKPETYARVRLTVKNSSGATVAAKTPNQYGYFEFEFAPGTYTVLVDSEYGIGGTHESHVVPIRANEQTTLNINIDTGIR